MKLYLSSLERKLETLPDNIAKECRFALGSFYYIKEELMPYYKSRKSFLMDSGAFTFRESAKSQLTYDDYERFTLRYADFIVRHDVKLFFEMDIDALIGLNRVEKLRTMLEARTGRPCIPVWHIERGKQYFIDMCRAYPYIAIGGIAGGTREQYAEYQKYFPWFIRTAHEHGAKIHGLGFTPGNLSQYAFDSVDSSSWTSGGRYGTLHTFDGTRIRVKRPAGCRAKDYRQIDQYNFLEWCAYQRYMERMGR